MIFEDFKEEGISSWLFYCLYVVRRIAIIISINLIEDPQLQMTIAFACSVSVRVI